MNQAVYFLHFFSLKQLYLFLNLDISYYELGD